MAIFGKGTRFLAGTSPDFRKYHNLGKYIRDMHNNISPVESELHDEIYVDVYSKDVNRVVPSKDVDRDVRNVKIPTAKGDVISMYVHSSRIEQLDNGFSRISLGNYEELHWVDVVHPDGSVTDARMHTQEITDAYVGYRWSLYAEKFNKSDKSVPKELGHRIRDSLLEFRNYCGMYPTDYEDAVKENAEKDRLERLEIAAEKLYFVDKKSDVVRDLIVSDRRLAATKVPKVVIENIPSDAIGPGFDLGEKVDSLRSVKFKIVDDNGKRRTARINVTPDCIEEHLDSSTVNVKLWKLNGDTHFARFVDDPESGCHLTKAEIIKACENTYSRSRSREAMVDEQLSAPKSVLKEIATNDYDTYSQFDT